MVTLLWCCVGLHSMLAGFPVWRVLLISSPAQQLGLFLKQCSSSILWLQKLQQNNMLYLMSFTDKNSVNSFEVNRVPFWIMWIQFVQHCQIPPIATCHWTAAEPAEVVRQMLWSFYHSSWLSSICMMFSCTYMSILDHHYMSCSPCLVYTRHRWVSCIRLTSCFHRATGNSCCCRPL